MAKINENNMAKVIARELDPVQQDTEYVKEIVKLVLDYIADDWESGNESGVIELLKVHSNSNNHFSLY